MTSNLALRPDTSEVLSRVSATSAAVASIVEVLPLESHADREQAAALARETSRLLAEADAARKIEKDPHLKAGQAVDKLFKAACSELARLDAALRRRIREALEADRARELAATQAARVAVLTGDAKAASVALAAIPEEAPRLDGVSARWSWEYTVQDLTAVPEAFTVRVVNDSVVRAEIEAARAQGRPPHVPGLVFRESAALAVKKGTP